MGRFASRRLEYRKGFETPVVLVVNLGFLCFVASFNLGRFNLWSTCFDMKLRCFGVYGEGEWNR